MRLTDEFAVSVLAGATRDEIDSCRGGCYRPNGRFATAVWALGDTGCWRCDHPELVG